MSWRGDRFTYRLAAAADALGGQRPLPFLFSAFFFAPSARPPPPDLPRQLRESYGRGKPRPPRVKGGNEPSCQVSLAAMKAGARSEEEKRRKWRGREERSASKKNALDLLSLPLLSRVSSFLLLSPRLARSSEHGLFLPRSLSFSREKRCL